MNHIIKLHLIMIKLQAIPNQAPLLPWLLAAKACFPGHHLFLQSETEIWPQDCCWWELPARTSTFSWGCSFCCRIFCHHCLHWCFSQSHLWQRHLISWSLTLLPHRSFVDVLHLDLSDVSHEPLKFIGKMCFENTYQNNASFTTLILEYLDVNWFFHEP